MLFLRIIIIWRVRYVLCVLDSLRAVGLGEGLGTGLAVNIVLSGAIDGEVGAPVEGILEMGFRMD